MAGGGGGPPLRLRRRGGLGRLAERCLLDRGGVLMAQYAVLIFEGAAELPPEVLEAHERLPARVAAEGGRIVAGLALESGETATSIRGSVVTDGPFIETKEVMA